MRTIILSKVRSVDGVFSLACSHVRGRSLRWVIHGTTTAAAALARFPALPRVLIADIAAGNATFAAAAAVLGVSMADLSGPLTTRQLQFIAGTPAVYSGATLPFGSAIA